MKLAKRALSVMKYLFGRAPRRTPMSLSPDAELYQDQGDQLQDHQRLCSSRTRTAAGSDRRREFAGKIALRKRR